MKPYTYLPNFLSKPHADAMFASLRGELDWVHRDGAPRHEYFSNDTPAPYTYGSGEFAHTYQSQPWHQDMLDIRQLLEWTLFVEFGHWHMPMDVCFLNLYLNQRDYLGWHSDDSPEMDDKRPIVSVSLGAVRDIQIKPKAVSDDAIETISLGHGSAFIMHPDMQDTHRHRIPKSGFVVGERISLTFRGYVK